MRKGWAETIPRDAAGVTVEADPGWRRVPLSSLVETSIGGVWGEEPGQSEVDIPVYRQTEFEDDGRLARPAGAVRSVTERQLAARTLRPGDILLQKSAGSPRLVGRVVSTPHDIDRPASFSNFVQLVRPSASAEPRFVFLLLQSLWVGGKALEMQAGTSIRNLRVREYLGQEVFAPPLKHQRRIVDVVASIDAYIASTKARASAAEQLGKAMEEEQFVDRGEVPITEITRFAGGYAFQRELQGNDTGDIPFFKVSDMNHPRNRQVMVQAENYVSKETLRTMRARAWPAGTVVFPKVGAALLTEKRRILGVEAAFDNNVMGLITLGGLHPRYLLSFMRTVKLADYAQLGAVPSVNQGHFKHIRMNVPTPAEQAEFVSRIVAVVQDAAAAHDAAHAAADLRSAIIGELLSGKHEIPDSYDVLLGVAA